MYKGKKLIGSAQKRTVEAVLQHGSIPLTGDFRDLPLYQNITEEQKDVFIKLLHQKCTCIEECLPDFNRNLLRESLKEGFSSMLPFQIEIKGWAADEVREIEKLASSEEFRYSFRSGKGIRPIGKKDTGVRF